MNPTNQARFWAKVHKTDGCWNWIGHRKPDGYGRYRIPTGKGSNGKAHYVHRLSYEMTTGPVPEGMQVDHLCHNTSCVRPSHLRLTTPKQNQENRTAANSGNISGVRGVTRNGNKWVARVRHEGKNHYAGAYPTISEAETAVIALRRTLFTHSDMDR